MKKRELIRYICSGGLRMYDDECSIRWHEMPGDECADWLVFFDMCRDDPGLYTEAVITAIMAGLCPQKRAVQGKMASWGESPDDIEKEKVWLFRTRPGFDAGNGTIPASLADCTHYFGSFNRDRHRGPWYCVPTAVGDDRRGGWWFKRYGVGAHAFKHPAHAWAFLFSFL